MFSKFQGMNLQYLSIQACKKLNPFKKQKKYKQILTYLLCLYLIIYRFQKSKNIQMVLNY